MTFGVLPATATGLDERRPYFNYGVSPGASLEDHFAVVNYSLVPLTLRIYATDALNDERGGFSLLPADKPAVDAGSWLALGTKGGSGQVTIPPQSRVILPVRLHVPLSASPGDHAAGIIASLKSFRPDKTGANVQLDQRVAARVYLRVTGALHPLLVVERIHTTYTDNWAPWWVGKAHVTYRIRNAGNVKLGGRLNVSVAGWLGTSSSSHKLPDLPVLLPGNHVDLSADVPGVVPVVWETTTVSVHPLLLPGDADPGLRNYSGSRFFLAVPWILIALVVAAVLFRWARKRFRGPGGRHLAKSTPPAPTAAEQVSA